MARENILNRMLRVEHKKNRYRFADWNLVNTTLGGMYEARMLSLIHLGSDNKFPASTPDDAMQRIDGFIFGETDDYFRDDSNIRIHGGEVNLGVTRSFTDDALV